MPVKTVINGVFIRNSVAGGLRPELQKKLRAGLELRLIHLDREAKQIAEDKRRVEELLKTLPET